jgi:two-component system, OmpR family, sensor histidine kinase VicK
MFLFGAAVNSIIRMTKNNLLSVLEAIGNLSSDGVFMVSLRHNDLEYVNDAMVRMFDISHESFRHQPAFFINHIIPEELGHLQLEYNRLLTDQKIESVEFMVRSHEGYVKNISSSCYVLENGKYIVGILKDITNVREHENYIINYGAKKNALLDMITHNLSGPLNVSKNMITLLEDMVKRNEVDNIGSHIRLVRENAQHCIDMISEFIEEEHLVSEHIYTKKNRFDLVRKIDTVMERLRKAYPDHQFVVEKQFDALYISNDDVKFLQVLNNLVYNAVKWSPEGSAIEIILEDADNACSITVRDHGIGIPDHLKGLIFQRNTPAGRPGLRGERSIGMGLYIVKKLVALMNGTISFESEVNKGTTFTLKLPKEYVEDQAAYGFEAGGKRNFLPS